MSILRPRRRVVYFRMSEEEFQEISRRCELEGARSISDYARSALQRCVGPASDIDRESVEIRLQAMDLVLTRLDRKMSDLLKLLQSPKKAERASAAQGTVYDGVEQ